jgi:enterochelin esterase-like enzyme
MKRTRFHPFRFLRVYLLSLTVAAGFAQMGNGQASRPATPPVPIPPPTIDESVPPPFDAYALGPDSLPQPSASAGKTFKFQLTGSNIFPNTVRTITVYIPAAYKGEKPACLYVALDGLSFNAPTVFDNLIAQHAVPVTIAIGLSSGVVDSASPPQNPRFDRSFEFDSRNDRLVRFLLDEVIPQVEQHRTPDGAPILLSNNPNDRAIGGASTGGIGAFTAAWERPDAFHRVFTSIGTFVGMRGGEQYYVLVRKTEPKPIRIFMQDGVNDEWGGGPEMGDWWMSNQTMNRALVFAGYDVHHVWGAGTHNGSHPAAIFPDAMRWLWSGWPTPIEPGQSQNPVLESILQLHEGWNIAAEGCPSASSISSNARGQVFYSDGEGSAVAELVPDQPMVCRPTRGSSPFAFGPGGKLYVSRLGGGIEVSSYPAANRPAKVIAVRLHIQSFTVLNNGGVYAVAEAAGSANDLWFLPADGKPVRLDTGLKGSSAVALSPDGLWLFVAQRSSRSGLSYRVLSDATVDSKEPFYDFYVPTWADDSGAAAIAMDKDGRAYVATRVGVQVFDRNGRVTAILPLPGNLAATGLCFGGPGFDTLYVVAGGKIFKRKLHVTGAPPFLPPFKLAPSDAG